MQSRCRARRLRTHAAPLRRLIRHQCVTSVGNGFPRFSKSAPESQWLMEQVMLHGMDSSPTSHDTSRKLRLSVLDQSPVRRGSTVAQALQETVQLARLADSLGYTRYWVSEHHNTSRLAGSTPAVLVAHLAGETQHIRLGSGGVMMPNHSALQVAENFRMLEVLFPGRIDLGMGRAPGTDRLTAALLNPSNTFSEEDFMQQLGDLQHYFDDTAQFEGAGQKVIAIPQATSVPAQWLLSSSGQSGLFAAHFGMGFSFAHFINPNDGPQAVQAYRQRFKPSGHLAEPQANFAITVLCADTDEKVKQLQAVMDYLWLSFERGRSEQGNATYDEIKNYQYSPAEWARVLANRPRAVSGTPEQVKAKLTQLAADYDVDEIIAVTITQDFADRLRSYELLAEMFELPKPAAITSPV